MAAIKGVDRSADKWSRRASAASGDYLSGVEAPRRPWAASAAEGEQNYKVGVIASANAGRYGKGVKKAGDEKWRAGASVKGPGRYAEGVNVGKGDWQSGFAPYHSAISSLVLPARGPKGAAQNIQRVAAVATTLRAVKERA